jgi:hypothetical protein
MGQFILFLMRYKISLSILLSRIHQVCRNSPRTADFIYHLVLLLEATMKTTLVEFFFNVPADFRPDANIPDPPASLS